MAIPAESFFLVAGSVGTLQHQIRQMVTEGILSGRFRVGDKMPSSRGLAGHLGISRITVTLAYTDLVASDYLTSRGRSGYTCLTARRSSGSFSCHRSAAMIWWIMRRGCSAV